MTKSTSPATSLRVVEKTPSLYEGQETRHVDSLRPHPENPRDEINPDDPRIIEMAGSIAKNGVIEPLVITPDNMVLAGHRRRIASRVAATLFKRPELLFVPVVIRIIKPEDVLEFILQENMQRQDLNMLEEARAISAIKEKKGFTKVADLARHLEISAEIISPLLAILKLPKEVQALYAQEELPLGAAPILSRVKTAAKQISYAGLLARRQISVTQFRKLATKDFSSEISPHQAETEHAAQNSKGAHLTAVPPPPNASRRGKKIKAGPDTHHQLAPTRDEAMAHLSKVLNRKISMISIKCVIEATCCACGMSGNDACCRACFLPKFVDGLVGRSEG